MVSESNVRRLAARRGYSVSKSRQQPHFDNQGEFMLADDRNTVVLGDRYDAALEDIAAHLRGIEPIRARQWRI